MDSSDDPQAQKYIMESKCLVSMVLLLLLYYTNCQGLNLLY